MLHTKDALTPMWFEDFRPGLNLLSLPYTVSREEVIAFATEWDPQPFHLDDEAAKQSVFGRLSACSAHIFSLVSKLAPQLTPNHDPQVVAGLGFDKLRTIKPLYAEDTVQFNDIIHSARRSKSRPEWGIITSHGKLINQHDEVIFEIQTSFMMQCDPDLKDR